MGHLMPGIVEWENLLLAFCRAERGLSDKHEADVYRENLDENLRFLLLSSVCFGFFPQLLWLSASILAFAVLWVLFI